MSRPTRHDRARYQRNHPIGTSRVLQQKQNAKKRSKK